MFIKVIILGVLVCIINLILKQHQKVFVLLVNIIYVVIVLLLIFDSFAENLQDIADLFSVSGVLDKALTCLYKSAAICILSKISIDLCKESGSTVISDMIDIGGRIIMLSLALPFIKSIIKTAAAFVK